MSATTRPDYAAGQRWRCLGRHEQEQPLLLIHRVDTHPFGGEIFHVSLAGTRLHSPFLPSGVLTGLPHLRLSRAALDASVTELIQDAVPMPDLHDDAALQCAPDARQAVTFGMPIADILANLQRAWFSLGAEPVVESFSAPSLKALHPGTRWALRA
ncbi:hypothetical protein [Lysobacter fragariae]